MNVLRVTRKPFGSAITMIHKLRFAEKLRCISMVRLSRSGAATPLERALIRGIHGWGSAHVAQQLTAVRGRARRFDVRCVSDGLLLQRIRRVAQPMHDAE